MSRRSVASLVIQRFFFFPALTSTSDALSTSVPWTFCVRLYVFFEHVKCYFAFSRRFK